MYTLKKSLGQHFLKDEHVIQQILAALQEKSFARLLEVGPGGGALTRYLIDIPDITFKAVELDEEKVNYLLQTFPALQNKIIHKSILDIDAPFEECFTVIGNFPYNISSQIVFKILDWKQQVDCVIGMFQKEVAQRIAAGPGSKTYGILSVLVQAWYKVEYLFEVDENCFTPPPKVKSAVVRFTALPEPKVATKEKQFFLLVKTAFNQRRKTLRNAVKTMFDENTLKDPVFNKRAEQLSVEDFVMLNERVRY